MAMDISNNSAFQKYIKVINATIPFIITTMKITYFRSVEDKWANNALIPEAPILNLIA
jgi:hypothetical protein